MSQVKTVGSEAVVNAPTARVDFTRDAIAAYQLSPQLLEIQAPLLGICCRCVKSIVVGYKCDKLGSNSCTPCDVNGNDSCEMVSFFRSFEARFIFDHR